MKSGVSHPVHRPTAHLRSVRFMRAVDDRLVWAGWLFAAGTAIHTFDHLRRGQGSVTEELYRAGTLSLTLQVIVITLVVTRHRWAPAAAAAAGFPLALAYAAAH